MKLVLLLYLEEDEACVDRFLTELDVALFTRLSVEGVGKGGAEGGWYGSPMPYASGLAFAIVPGDRASRLLEAVAEGRGGLDRRKHPVRAFQLPVDAVSSCGAAAGDQP